MRFKTRTFVQLSTHAVVYVTHTHSYRAVIASNDIHTDIMGSASSIGVRDLESFRQWWFVMVGYRWLSVSLSCRRNSITIKNEP